MAAHRIFIPIAAGIFLAGICAWRVATNRPQEYADQVAAAVMTRAAPGFELLDSDNRLIRLGTYLGRHQIVVFFFDGDAGADKDPELLRLRERYAELQSHNVKVIAVSGAIPQHNRAAMDRVGPFPFPLVSDIDPIAPEGALRVHREWGRISDTGKPRIGVFLIDRKGQIRSAPDGPQPLKNVDEAVDVALSR